MENTIKELGQIKEIRLRIDNRKRSAITALYKFIFEKEGDHTQRERLRKFKGFAFEKPVPTYEKKFQYAEQLLPNDLIHCCKILGLEHMGMKKQLITRIFNGLMDLNTLVPAADNQHDAEKNNKIDEKHNENKDEKTDAKEQNEDISQSSMEENKQTHMTDEDMKVSFQFFNGSDTYSMEKWITDVENVATLLKLTEEQKLIFAKLLLTGLAKMWVKDKGNVKSWKNLKTISKQWSDEINNNQLHKDLAKRKMEENETVQDYYVAMKKLAQGQIKLEIFTQYVINGIPDDTNNKVILYGASDSKDFSKKLKLYEAIRKEEYEKMKGPEEDDLST